MWNKKPRIIQSIRSVKQKPPACIEMAHVPLQSRKPSRPSHHTRVTSLLSVDNGFVGGGSGRLIIASVIGTIPLPACVLPSPPTYPSPNAPRRAADRPETRISPTGTIRRPPPASYASPDSIAGNARPQTPAPFLAIVVPTRVHADPPQHTVSAARTYLPTPAMQRHRSHR